MACQKNSFKKITLIVHDLSSNPIVRAYPLALALQRLGYDVEIVGFLIKGNRVYAPYKNKFDYKTISIKENLFSLLKGLPKLLGLIKGDIIYACKPLMSSYLPALINSGFGKKKPLLLDVEDDELYFKYSLKLKFVYNFFILGLIKPNSQLYLLMLHKLLFPAKFRTVVSSKLQERYGGEILLHGPDEKIFEPSSYDRKKCRAEFDLPEDKILLLFAGMPRKYKGIDFLIDALLEMNDERFFFVGAGPSDHEGFLNAKKKLGSRCKLLGNVDNKKMPELLTACDIVPILQQSISFTESQMPAKLFEAMAMKKIIISTDISDIGKVLGKNESEENKRGYLINHGNTKQLVSVLRNIAAEPETAKTRALNGRNYFLRNASIKANEKKFEKLLKHICF